METLFWSLVFIFWLLWWRPGMVQWWRTRGMTKEDIKRIREVNYLEEMFHDG